MIWSLTFTFKLVSAIGTIWNPVTFVFGVDAASIFTDIVVLVTFRLAAFSSTAQLAIHTLADNGKTSKLFYDAYMNTMTIIG